ncbi:class I adenylate-forming enzyme family protein [Pelomonas sp. KK5]|uniref:class I adenylate-forming enzyme family protein n=1 Tax=Pelomonas sp. KK5 TaxID=1855730 RepID=UPI00097BFD7A|nr:class I adenylate-forming enzyme family protein [Pelomonas sp. KK5]
MQGRLIDAIKWWARERAAQDAIISSTGRVTHGELERWSAAIGDWLLAEGLQPGDRVTIHATNCLEWCVMAVAVMDAGGLLAPLNPRFTASEARYVLGRYEPKFLFHDAAREPVAQEALEGLPGVRCWPLLATVERFRHVQPAPVRPVRAGITPDTPVVIIGTSGSTGYPKGVVYSHRTMMGGFADLVLAHPHAMDKPRTMMFGPLCMSAGYYVLLLALVYGGTVFVEDAFDPVKALRRVGEDRITILMGVPVFFERMAASAEFAGTDTSSIRMMQCGGARVSARLIEAWRSKGLVFQQMYGQTEAGGNATINPLGSAVAHPTSCGRGMPFTRLATIDESGRPCPPGTPGEIVIQGPALMVGYWRDPEATAKVMGADGWLRTGDLGVMDENGLLTFVDRLKDIIISGGVNISAAEIERVVADFPGVEEVAAIAAKDERFGETPMAVVYAPRGLDVAALVAHCNTHLSDYKVPRYVAVHAEPLPRLPAGKLSKLALRKQYERAHVDLPRVR